MSKFAHVAGRAKRNPARGVWHSRAGSISTHGPCLHVHKWPGRVMQSADAKTCSRQVSLEKGEEAISSSLVQNYTEKLLKLLFIILIKI
jgi:hypothetical protein